MCANVRTEAAQQQTAVGQPSGVVDDPGQEALRGLRPERRRMQPALRRAFEALEESGISWALLRGDSELASNGQDVDILAAPSDLSRLEKALAPLGYARLRSRGRGTHSFFVAYDNADGSWVKLDVVTDLAFGRYQELRLQGAAGCLDRRRQIGQLVVLAPGDAFWTLLLHCLLDAGKFTEAHRRSLLDLADQAQSSTSPLVPALERAVGGGWAHTLFALATAGDWAPLGGTAPSLRAAWVRRRPLAVRRTFLRNAALRRAGRFPPLCRHGLVLSAQPADWELAGQVAASWFLSHRLVRLGRSPVAQLSGATVARWHATRGRLVIVELGESAPPSRWLGWMSGAFDFRSVAGLTPAQLSLRTATAQIWRRFSEGAGA
jgi:hypothetical protein